MSSVELKISFQDWIYIVMIGGFFGFFISWFFFFINVELQQLSTIIFTLTTSIVISLFASILITISNNLVLPNVDKKFWYIISFLFSFFSGAFGFLVSFFIFNFFDIAIVNTVFPYWFHITIISGLLTFLIGLVLHQFISMKYKNESIKSEILDSKIKALENELNPHFLFNSLNSISELVYIDKTKAEDAILNLSKFLRNAITKESLISLSKELDMLKAYLDIEKIRFEDRLILNIDVQDKDVLDILVPKFSIQLLVENAIKHGFSVDKLVIDVIVNKSIIEVSNNGKITKNVVFNTGLSNLDSRLKLLNIGSLSYKNDNKMSFFIELKG